MSKLPWRLLRQRLLRQQFTNHVLCLDEQGAPLSGLGSGFFSSEACGHYDPSGSHHFVGVASFWKHWEEVLQTHGVPEPMWSVKWILEHVMGKGGTKGSKKVNTFKHTLILLLHARDEKTNLRLSTYIFGDQC